MEKLKNYIAGEWTDARSGRTGRRENPANPEEIVAEFPLSDAEDVKAAVAAARAAQGGWRATPAPRRGAIILRAMEILARRADELAAAMTLEEGKLLPEAKGEVQKSVNVLEFIAGEGRRLGGRTLPSEMPSTFCYTTRDPVGVVAVITPWNFPVAIPVWKTAPALVAGNAVVFKPASLTPICAKLVVEVFAEAGVPRGVLNLVYGPGGAVGGALVEHPDVRALTFTGSTEVGLALYGDAAKLGKKVQCEMGGKNAIVVYQDADLELAAAAAVQGAFGSTGQRCTATSRAVVAREVVSAFTDLVVEQSRRFEMGPLVERSAQERVLSYVQTGSREGARLLCGGKRPERPGYFVEPTVFCDVRAEMRLAQEEVFGPLLSIIPVESEEQAVEVANGVAFGLSASVYTRDLPAAMRFCQRAEVGIVHVNQPTVGGEAQMPFGGVKATGVGPREQGDTAIEFFTELKTVYLDYTGRRREGNLY
ncbi:MAG: aldehyde dehydrogenase family protein [Myxococcota bacterium]